MKSKNQDEDGDEDDGADAEEPQQNEEDNAKTTRAGGFIESPPPGLTKAQLKKWKRGELPAAGMMQHLQRLMHDGHLDPRWLWSGELAAQGNGKGKEEG